MIGDGVRMPSGPVVGKHERSLCVEQTTKDSQSLLFIEYLRRQKRIFKRLRKLSNSDVVVVSQAKSGRTWLAAMMSHVYHQACGVDERLIIRFDNFHRINPEIPRIFFTHDNRKSPDMAPLAAAERYANKKVILLVRDPRDVAVSAFFHSRRNLSKRPTGPNGSGDVGTDDIYDYVTGTLPLIINFLKRWDENLSDIEQSLVVRYEDLRADPSAELAGIMDFTGGDFSPEIIEKAVDFASFEKLRTKEAARFFESDRLHPADPDDPGSYKVRRGKVGGYRDYFTPAQLARIDAMVADAGLDRFGFDKR